MKKTHLRVVFLAIWPSNNWHLNVLEKNSKYKLTGWNSLIRKRCRHHIHTKTYTPDIKEYKIQQARKPASCSASQGTGCHWLNPNL